MLLSRNEYNQVWMSFSSSLLVFEDNLFFKKWELHLQFFKDFGNIPFFQKRDAAMVLSNTFKHFVGMLLGPAGFSRFNVILKTALPWVLLVSQKTFFQVDCQGSLIVFYLFAQCCFLFFSNCGKKLLQVIAYSTSSSYHLL